MKKYINPAPPLAMPTTRNPLNTILTIEIVGDGSLTQAQDSTRNLWKPNRDPSAGGLDPLILKPKLEVFNQDRKAKVSVQPSFSWYVGDETVETAVNASEVGKVTALAGLGTDLYYLETNDNTAQGTPTGRLVIRKNVDYRSGRRIILKAAFTDGGRNYEYQAEVALSSANRPEDFYTVHLQCPNTVKFNPLGGGSGLRTFRAVAKRGKDDVSASCKFFWRLDGVNIPTDGSVPCYQAANQPSGKGQGKDTIVLDLDCVDGKKLSVHIGDSLSAASPMDYTSDCCALTWDIPDLELTPYSKGARHVKDTDKKKEFASILRADGVDVSDALRKEYFLQQWWIRPTNTQTKTMLQWGMEQVIDASLLKKSGNVNVDINADYYLLGPLEILVDDTGSPGDEGYMEPLTDDSGSDTASAYSGFVVGRCWEDLT